ncbi:MAG: glycosyltransferase family 2 protein [Chloroflexi bacterium]|nr:MAG: glycosyltransferase family 2 protein [Chloroflexota bacterium]
MIDVAVVIVSWNVRDYLRDCLASVFAEAARANLQVGVWVVDNQSQDDTVAMVKEQFSQVHLIANEHNPGFGAANNQGMQAAKAHQPRFYFMLNPDTVMQPGSLLALVDCLEKRPFAGMAGARLVYGDGRFQHSAFAFPGIAQMLFELFPLPARFYESGWNGRYPRSQFTPDHEPFPVDHPLGASMMVRATVAEQTNGFDEQFHMYCEEIDWAWRIREAGWQIFVVPAAEIIHFGGESTGQIRVQSMINLWRSRAKLYRIHHAKWRFKLAQKLVAIGMRRRATQETNPDLKNAYQTIIHIWQKESS